MSKKTFKKSTKRASVQAVFSRFKRDRYGSILPIILYNLYGPEYLKRNNKH